MSWLLFLAYLGYTAYSKYYVTAPASPDQPYITNALIVLSATLIVPFFVSYLFTRATHITGRTPAIMLGFIASVVLAVAGSYVFDRYLDGTTSADLQQAVRLALVPGLIMGAILAAGTFFRSR
jgi:hypothetical protein